MLIHLLCSPEFWIGVAATLSLLVGGALVFLIADQCNHPPIGGAWDPDNNVPRGPR
jgi:hypothetical protein